MVGNLADKIKDMTNIELLDYLHSVPGHYSDYSSLYTYLKKHAPMHDYYKLLFKDFDLKHKSFLDLGPGVGWSLDVARELGARTTFVDRDIFITKYCENKGHKGIHLDFFQLPIKNIGRYDLILSRGSFNVDMMNRTNFPIHQLIGWMILTGRNIIVIPTWDKGELVEGEDYTCVGEHFENYLNSEVHWAFVNSGFSLRIIEGINDHLRFPITYEYTT
jgi:hypothetical protein